MLLLLCRCLNKFYIIGHHYYYYTYLDLAVKFKHFTCSYQEGLKQSKVLQEEKQEEENAAEKLLELKNKDEESGKKRRTSR